MKIVEHLIRELIAIEHKLEQLNIEIDLEPSKEVEALNNVVHQTTHEIASEIGFNRMRILYLAKYIEFKAKYDFLAPEDLEKVIDTDHLSLSLKQQLFKGVSPEEKLLLLRKIESLKKDWGEQFDHKTFKEIKRKYLA